MTTHVTSTENGIYFGDRGKVFTKFIRGMLELANIKEKYILLLTNEEAMAVYGAAFTSETVDPEDNYQQLEQVGDLSGNKFIVSYMRNRFPS